MRQDGSQCVADNAKVRHTPGYDGQQTTPTSRRAAGARGLAQRGRHKQVRLMPPRPVTPTLSAVTCSPCCQIDCLAFHASWQSCVALCCGDICLYRCWLNTLCALLFNSRGRAEFCHCQPLTLETHGSCEKQIFLALVRLHHALRDRIRTTSSMELFILLGKAHPRLVSEVRTAHGSLYEQQDVEEALLLVFDTLLCGMGEANVSHQVKPPALLWSERRIA